MIDKFRREKENERVFREEADEAVIEHNVSHNADTCKSEGSNIIDTIYQADAAKALTGRTPKDLILETGLPENELFPEDKPVLYVGDPWQKMGTEKDNPNMTIIDYEYGEPATFIKNIERFKNTINYNIKKLNRELGINKESHYERVDLYENFQRYFDQAVSTTDNADLHGNFSGCTEASLAWIDLREYIGSVRAEVESNAIALDKYGESNFWRDSWYSANKLAQGFADVPDYYQIVLPKLEEFKEKISELSEKDREKALRKKERALIEDIRLVKKPKEAHVVQGVFPELPFKSDSFERLVFSWSISVHSFDQFDDNDFYICWQEILRVLKPGGKAIIFPVNEEENGNRIAGTLNYYKSQKRLDWQVLDETGKTASDDERWCTLVINKNNINS